jgi:ribosomal protein S18 acetylase RimI-like enzyme
MSEDRATDGILYTTSLRGITPEKLDGFFVGWKSAPSPRKHLEILAGSDHVVLAVDAETKKVAGFITAITDGVLSAYIPLLEVLPDYQKRGIGSNLVRRMLEEIGELYMIDLMCDTDLRQFYEKLGLRPAFGMVRRDYERQSGR